MEDTLGFKKTILENLRNRELSQKFTYIGDGASNYYEYDRSFWTGDKEDFVSNYLDFKVILEESIENISSKKILFISMGCGDSLKELNILNDLNNPNIKYIGIDFSKGMINLSKENMKSANFENELLVMDIEDRSLKSYLDEIGEEFEEKIFLFFGGTFGNSKATSIVDLLGYYTEPGDKLLMDVATKGDGAKDNINIFNSYRKKLDDELNKKFLMSGFKDIGFPTEKTTLSISTEGYEHNGVFRIMFHITILEDISFSLGENNETVIFGEGERLKFFDVHYYFPEKLVKFMKLHRFNLITKNKKDIHGQFLFEKADTI